MHTTLHVQNVHSTTCTQHHIYNHAHCTICTQHRMYNLCTAPYVHCTAYTTCTLHQMSMALHSQHVHNTICTYYYIYDMYLAPLVPKTAYTIMHTTLYMQHAHNIICTQYYICYMYTTLVLHILRPHCPYQATLLLVSYPCLSQHVVDHTTSTLLMYPSALPSHNINTDIVQTPNINSYPHDTYLIDLSGLFFPLDSS